MNGKKDIFRQFQDQQSAWDEAPPASAWERLEARLDAEPPNHPGRPWKPFILPGIGVLLLLALLGWGLLSGPGEGEMATKTETEQVSPLADNEPVWDQRVVPNEEEQWVPDDPAPPEEEAPREDPVLLANDPELDGRTPSLLNEGWTRVAGPQVDSTDLNRTDASVLGNPALPPMAYQRAVTDNPLDDMLPLTNVAPYNYDNSTLNPGNMVVTNGFGNIVDTVRSIGQYVEGLDATSGNYPGYLQMNATRNDISYAPRGGYRTRINPSKLEHFNWLLGSWRFKGPSGGTESFEEWERVDAFNFEGRGFLVVNGDTVITDRMRIEQRGSNVYYIAALDTNQTPMRFRLRSNTPGEAVFKNPSRGFPNEVILRQGQDGKMETILNNGKSNPRKREEVIRNLSRE